jgi:hypothetical protein
LNSKEKSEIKQTTTTKHLQTTGEQNNYTMEYESTEK